MGKVKMQARTLQFRLTLFTSLLALCVIVMGAYVRLSDAGLGCPDWPGCYGQLDVPTAQHEIDAANAAYPQRPVETAKAWKEMVHRYLAGLLGLVILALAVLAWRQHRESGQPLLLPSLLPGLVLFQGLLGMWTVTLLVKPAVVTAHLLGGMATLSLLWLLTLQLAPAGWQNIQWRQPGRLLPLSIAGLTILVVQITLGGWTSTNYAATGCIEFPSCYGGDWWPAMDFRGAFVIWHGLGINYEYGILDSSARTAIHMSHRLGALVTALYFSGLCLYLLRQSASRAARRLAAGLLLLLLLQLTLGVTNVLAQLPLSVAVAHNGVAAMLLLALLTLIRSLSAGRGEGLTNE